MTRRATESRPELADPLYYLRNFDFVVDWVEQRYPDLLAERERALMARIRQLPEPARALLVRMVMRKGELFRADRLNYSEIGPAEQAAEPLLKADLLTRDPPLESNALCHLLTLAELRQVARQAVPAAAEPAPARKRDLQAWLQQHGPAEQLWSSWWPDAPTPLYRVEIMPFCDRLRLMFFGNLRQEWSTFVLAELGLFRYETVTFDRTSRPFSSAREIDTWLHLHQCRERLEQGESAADILPAVPNVAAGSDWLTARRDRLLYQIAYRLERQDDLETAAELYRRTAAPGARQRLIRVLERQQQPEQALAVLLQARARPESEAERQQLERMAARLHRKAGRPGSPGNPAPKRLWSEARVSLATEEERVERAVAAYLERDNAPVFWVENALINSLLGLLCWPAIFAPLPGAFFHPYQSGPADLNRPDFRRRREALFEQALATLNNGTYRAVIIDCWEKKQGLQNPFVHWGLLSEELLGLALDCIPTDHLGAMFRRILFDIRANRSGLPDLVQFYPQENRYRMIEVKGPGDRLQDNQSRWLAFCCENDIPVAVTYVDYAE